MNNSNDRKLLRLKYIWKNKKSYTMKVFYVISIFFTYGSICAYCNEVSLLEMPGYFTSNTWDKINEVNEKIKTCKIAAVIDQPIYFVAGLKDKEIDLNLNYTKAKVEDNEHGTEVAGLIAADPKRLPCKDTEKKKCPYGGKLLVAGISRNTKVAYIPIPDDPDEISKIIMQISPEPFV